MTKRRREAGGIAPTGRRPRLTRKRVRGLEAIAAIVETPEDLRLLYAAARARRNAPADVRAALTYIDQLVDWHGRARSSPTHPLTHSPTQAA